MQYKDIQEIILIYGKKDLILEFLEKFCIDREHDGAELKAVLLKGGMKKKLKDLYGKATKKYLSTLMPRR